MIRLTPLLRTLVAAVVALSLTTAVAQSMDGVEVPGPILDIATTDTGTILTVNGFTLDEVSNDGVSTLLSFALPPRTTANGVYDAGNGVTLIATGGADKADGAALWSFSNGTLSMLADIDTFETALDPDAFLGAQWKHPECEEDPAQSYTAGPQSNPYHVTTAANGTAYVADAAGNYVFAVRPNGSIDVVAVLTPPVDENGDYRVLKNALNAPEIVCYVQPVPTSVAIGDDGAVYIGELTGAPALPGWSRVWRVEPGATGVACPSDACTEVVSGLTSVVDVAIGPDGMLYVAELDAASWLSPFSESSEGGTIQRCDVDTGSCELVEQADGFVGALAFDADGTLWTVVNTNIFGAGPATVRPVDLP